MAVSETVILDTLNHVLWPFMRISTFIMGLPIIGTHLLPMRIRLGLAVLVSLVVTPLIAVPSVDLLSFAALAVLLQQLLLGLLMSFCLQIVIECFILAGQIVAMQAGLGFASMNDPISGVSIPIIGQFYMLLAGLLFFTSDGHLASLQFIVDSFNTWPISSEPLPQSQFWTVIHFVTWCLQEAMLLALPIVICLLLANLAFGILTRAAPQLNIFAIGFPITLTLGIFLVYLTLRGFAPHIAYAFRQGFAMMRLITS